MSTKTMSAPKTAKQIANRLVELCQQGKFEEAIKELYNKDAESIEPAKAQGWDTHIKGLDKFFEKGEKWRSMTETFHGLTVTDPIVMGNQIALGITMDVTMKGQPRNNFEEIAVYEVADGKIMKEQFFY
jgi:SnoaL-like domain